MKKIRQVNPIFEQFALAAVFVFTTCSSWCNEAAAEPELKLESNQIKALTQLTFSSNRIDESLLRGLDQLGNLKVLKLRSFGSDGVITDKGISQLKKLRQLKELYLTGCENLTAEKLASLKKALPNCKVKWSIPR